MALAVACGGSSSNKNNPTATEAATAGSPTAMETPSGTGTPEAMASPGQTMAANEVHVGETEYKIANEDGGGPITNPPVGSVTFEVHNNGTIQHEFIIFKTDLDEGSLPLSGTTVDETGAGLTKIDEIEAQDPGSAKTLTVNLEPGKYVVICNIAGHYQQGMHASFTVM
jgi:hypothetical protein